MLVHLLHHIHTGIRYNQRHGALFVTMVYFKFFRWLTVLEWTLPPAPPCRGIKRVTVLKLKIVSFTVTHTHSTGSYSQPVILSLCGQIRGRRHTHTQCLHTAVTCITSIITIPVYTLTSLLSEFFSEPSSSLWLSTLRTHYSLASQSTSYNNIDSFI